LSGGQRQRVALARAVLADPKILLLDDATSAVDSRIEAEIHQTLREVLAGRTTLLVAHRRSTLLLADRIAVLDAGRVVDVGTHEQLEGRCSLYRLLLTGPGDELAADPDNLAEPPAEDVTVDGITPALWIRTGDEEAAAGQALAATGKRDTGSLGVGIGGPGGGPGGGAMGMLGGLPASPELLARVDALRPANDEPDQPLDDARDEDRDFQFTRFIRPWRRQLAVGFGLVALDAVASLAGPLLIRHGIDAGIDADPQSMRAVWMASLAYLFVVTADFFVMTWETFITGRTAERSLWSLRVKVFSHLQRLGLDYYDREMGGRIMTRMTSDIEALTSLLQTGLVTALVALLTCVGVGVALVVMDWRLALMAMVVMPPLVAATVWFRRRSGAAYDDARDKVAVVNADFQESLTDVRVAQAFTREDQNTKRFAGRSRDYLGARLRAQQLVAIYFPFVEFLSGVAGAIVLAGGAALVRDDAMATGTLIAFVLYLDLFFSPIQQLSQVFDTYQQARVALVRIGEVLGEPSSIPEADDPVHPGQLTGRIELQDVRFAYASTGLEVLHGVDLTIEAGETVAIVGETGAGKSTVEKLVARYYDVSSGSVRIDGTDIRDLDLGEYRRQLGVVPQEAFLFAGTIRDNLAYGRPDATDAEVEDAARSVGAHDVIASLPGGYLHVVGEQGRSLSAGQRQLLALARAQVVDPKILLLDEATANLDLASEARVSEAMGMVTSGRTALVIAHRLSTAVTADKIVVMDDGLVAEVGTHADLLAADGTYARLWSAFNGEAPPDPEPAVAAAD
ncbi:MAG TPA: ABC transporter transmembrane domain-containing protein, partial [Acidimicrobiales bacterium]|nr:ABC transporter transmembrane domain-containing protein [Acidimicrobiales bacterium]